ncbi:MAG: glycosyltransferase [Bacteroidota bacterium]
MASLNILYIGYWSALDGLSEATIYPHLKVLSEFENVNKIFYVSIERSKQKVKFNISTGKISHIPYHSPPRSFFLDKVEDFTKLPKFLTRLCRQLKIDKIICRSSSAGGIGFLVWKRTNIPYYVESFEPHAAYMRESKVWSKWGLRYWVQIYFEKAQKKTATKLIAVSNGYKRYLIHQEKVKVCIEVLPCTVDLDKFSFKSSKRNKVRSNLDIAKDALVGIYVGKFGGIYYEKEAWVFFAQCFAELPEFTLLLITTDEPVKLINKLNEYHLPMNRIIIDKVAHDLVPAYLSAADIAFNLHKTGQWSFALSPIKNGEYWANGLPIVISRNIGDDSSFIYKSRTGGKVVNFGQELKTSIRELRKLKSYSTASRKKNDCTRLARMHRTRTLVEMVYSKILW